MTTADDRAIVRQVNDERIPLVVWRHDGDFGGKWRIELDRDTKLCTLWYADPWLPARANQHEMYRSNSRDDCIAAYEAYCEGETPEQTEWM